MNAFALKLLYLRENGYALVSIGYLPMKIWKYFFEELTNSLSKASESYEHLIIMGDFNIHVTNRGVEFNMLDEFCDFFNLTNLITSPTCFTKTHKSTIDLLLTNKKVVSKKQK